MTEQSLSDASISHDKRPSQVQPEESLSKAVNGSQTS